MIEFVCFTSSIALFVLAQIAFTVNWPSHIIPIGISCSYLILKFPHVNMFYIIICALILMLLVVFTSSKYNYSENTSISTISIFWIFMFVPKIENFLDLGIFVLGVKILLYYLGGEEQIKLFKLLQEFKNEAITHIMMIVALVLTFFSVKDSETLFMLENLNANKVVVNLVFVYFVFSLGVIGPFSIKNRYRVTENYFSNTIAQIVNFIVLPIVIGSLLKDILITISENSNYLSITLLIIAFSFSINMRKDIPNRCRNTVTIFGTFSLTLLFVLSPTMSVLFLGVGLVVNYLQYLIRGLSFKHDVVNKLVGYLFFGGPISILFYFKYFFLEDMLIANNWKLNLILILFMYFPLIAYPWVNDERVSNDKI